MLSFSTYKKVIYLAAILAFAVSAYGQDLGSSNKLFGGKKTTAASKTAKKTPAKHKPTAAKTTAASKKNTTSGKTAAKTGSKAVPKNGAKTTQKTAVRTAPNGAKIIPKTTGTANKPPQTTTTSSKFTEFKTNKPTPNDARPRELNLPTGAAADTLFEKLIIDGNNARDDRNYTSAEAAYQRAAAIKPRDPRAVYGLGNLYSDQQRWEDAERSYRAALQLDPRDPIAHIALSYVLSQPVAAPDLSARYEEAEKLARRAIELGPASPLAFDQLGVALELRGLISSETENAYRKSIQLDPSFAPAYAHLGRLLRRRGLTRESASAYQNAINYSTDVGTMVLVAEVMQSEQRYAESEHLLLMALNKDPKNPSALLLLGRALTTQGNFADAERMLKRSIDVSPDGFMPNSLLGSLYARQGKFELAENALLQALRFVPVLEKRRLARQFEAVGDGYLKSGKRINAERSYRQAMNLDAENTILPGKLAKAHGG